MRMHSVALTDIPYTGFDYGEPYNSLFWVALALWSIIISTIIMYKRQSIGRGVNALARVFMVSSPTPEPRFVHERVVAPALAVPEAPRMVPEYIATPRSPLAPISQETVRSVTTLVAEELAESRVGDFVEEFTEDDFATMDFDGVNPDDSWVPRAVSEDITSYRVPTPAPVVAPRITPSPFVAPPQVVAPAHVAVPPAPASVAEKPVENYTDTLTLTVINGLPRMVLTREAVT